MKALVSNAFNQPTLTRGLSSALEDFIEDFFGDNDGSLLNNLESKSYPRVNIRQLNDKVLFECAVPGLTKEDVVVDYQPESRSLVISGKTQNSKEDNQNGYIKRELHKSSFKRFFTLGRELQVDRISAEVKNGMLTIEIPKKEIETPEYKKIEVK